MVEVALGRGQSPKTIEVSSVGELTALVSGVPDTSLFRGQTQHYKSQRGEPSLVTSFDRAGCNPPTMIKWSHYAKFLFHALGVERPEDHDLEYIQAVLQHYGWRSFYLDFSSSSAVSAWFAAHKYKSDKSIYLAEDCHEDPAFLVSTVADYSVNPDPGHLYVVCRDRLAKAGVKTFDLSSIPVFPGGGRPRFVAQSAWLVGPLRRAPLPSEAITHHITAPATVFAEFAALQGHDSVAGLFPTAAEDPYYQRLLSIPWRELKIPGEKGPGIPVFKRGLELPEYNYSPTKHLPLDVALFDEFWVWEYAKTREPPFSTATPVVIPEGIYFGHSDQVGMAFPAVTSVLRRTGSLILETDNLIRFPEFADGISYSKGLFVELTEEGAVSVGDLVVDQAGLQQFGCGANFGWHYSLDDSDRWTRYEVEGDCPCENKMRHEHHLGVIQRVEELLAENAFDESNGVLRLKAAHPLAQ